MSLVSNLELYLPIRYSKYQVHKMSFQEPPPPATKNPLDLKKNASTKQIFLALFVTFHLKSLYLHSFFLSSTWTTYSNERALQPLVFTKSILRCNDSCRCTHSGWLHFDLHNNHLHNDIATIGMVSIRIIFCYLSDGCTGSAKYWFGCRCSI